MFLNLEAVYQSWALPQFAEVRFCLLFCIWNKWFCKLVACICVHNSKEGRHLNRISYPRFSSPLLVTCHQKFVFTEVNMFLILNLLRWILEETGPVAWSLKVSCFCSCWLDFKLFKKTLLMRVVVQYEVITILFLNIFQVDQWWKWTYDAAYFYASWFCQVWIRNFRKFLQFFF